MNHYRSYLTVPTSKSPIIDMTQAAVKEVAARYSCVKTRHSELDMSSRTAVRKPTAVANDYPEKHVDVLINNAAVMSVPTRILSTDGKLLGDLCQ
jgi:NADP-dependent 3-hydroxy acid dehydrogenase YdfG